MATSRLIRSPPKDHFLGNDDPTGPAVLVSTVQPLGMARRLLRHRQERAVINPINVMLTLEEVRYVVEDSGARVGGAAA
jgi:hypothetical protein